MDKLREWFLASFLSWVMSFATKLLCTLVLEMDMVMDMYVADVATSKCTYVPIEAIVWA